ncbi:MAG: hypothetical protein HYR72_27120 [Deltaproteobacteria bacterium]|nr:hypothetical protein [Deltaproteobacteria bacterium]MBI3390313.1 hypothetical protein [Deltaproteobacteria bacterium]
MAGQAAPENGGAHDQNADPKPSGRRKRLKVAMRKLQLVVDEGTADKAEEIMDLNNFTTLAQSFRRAAEVTVFVDRKRKEGYEVIVKKGDEIYKLFP